MKNTFKPVAMAALAALLSAGAAAQAQTVLKIGYATAATSHYGVGSTVFCEEMEKGTQGRYKCQQFANSALGGEREQIEAVQLGTQDLVNTSTGPLGNFVPEVKIVDIPFLFRDYDTKKAMIEDLRQPITVEMVMQEINRYADSEFRYADKSDEFAIENAVREMGRLEEAKRRYLEGKG